MIKTVVTAADRLLNLAGGLAGLLLLFIAWYGGFRLRTAWGVASVPGFDLALWICAAVMVLAALVHRLGYRATPGFDADDASPLSRVGVAGLVGMLVLLHGGLLLRSCYLSYYEHMMKVSAPIVPPLWMSVAIYGAVAVSSAEVWLAARRHGGYAGASIAVVLMALSPMMLHVSDGIAIAYACALGTWCVCALVAAILIRFKRWLFWSVALILVVAGALVLHFAGYGWAGGRVAGQVGHRLVPVPGLFALLALGIWRMVASANRLSPAFGGALLAAALGLVAGGMPRPHGDMGVFLALPLMVILAGYGAAQCLESGRRLAGVYGRNLALFLILALLVASMRAGTLRSVTPGPDGKPESVEIEDGSAEGGEEK